MNSAMCGDDDAITAPLPMLTALPGFDEPPSPMASPRNLVSPGGAGDPAQRPASLEGRSHTDVDNGYGPALADRAVDPFTPKRRRGGLRDSVNKKAAAAGAGAAAVAIAAGLILQFAVGPDHGDSANTTPSSAESAPSPADQARLANTLSPAFSAAMSCQPGESNPSGTLASVHCIPRVKRASAAADATYRLAGHKDDLDALLKTALHQTTLQLCPGRLLSPGPWHLTTNPNAPSGILFCGTRGDTAVIGWTDADKLTLAEICSAPLQSPTQRGPALAGLYQWWQKNSYRA